MNFVMGFLLINFQNEETTFKIFVQLMKQFLEEGYKNEFQ